MKTTADWISEIEQLFDAQKLGRIKPSQAVEMNNTVGKLIGITKLQIEYHKLKQQCGSKMTKIPTLEATKAK